jgi:hypothetical protein
MEECGGRQARTNAEKEAARSVRRPVFACMSRCVKHDSISRCDHETALKSIVTKPAAAALPCPALPGAALVL